MITILQQRALKYGLKEILKLKKYFSRDQELDTYYFGYGANLSIDRFKKWYIPAAIVGTGFIGDHRIMFNLPCEYKGKGFAGIESCQGRKVWGILFKVNSKALKMLDVLEWVPFKFYERKRFSVNCNGETYTSVFSYQTCHPRYNLIPSKAYLDYIIQSGKRASFPDDYLSELSSHPSETQFEIDTRFVLRNPSKTRILAEKLSKFYRVHDNLREKLTRLIP